MGSYRATNQVGQQDPEQRSVKRKARREQRRQGPVPQPGDCMCGVRREQHEQLVDANGRVYRGRVLVPGVICHRYEAR